MKKLKTIVLFLLLSFAGFSQTDNKDNTYQLIFATRGSEEQITLTNTDLQKIDSLRNDQTQYYYFNDQVIIKILPVNKTSEKNVLYIDEIRENIFETRNIKNFKF